MKYVVTGSSSGLGFAITQRLLEHGDVVGVSRHCRSVTDASNSKRYTHIETDLSKESAVVGNSTLIKRLRQILGSEEFVLILNAGVFYSGSRRLPSGERTNLFWVNLFSIMELVRHMRELNVRRMFFINSISGLIGQEAQHEYVSSKHALMGFIRSLIKEARGSSFDVMAINPGGINTELWDKYPALDARDFLCPDELASIVVRLITVKQRMFIPSFTILPSCDV